MAYPYSYTIPGCHDRRRLAVPLRQRLDKLVLGLRLVPHIGCYDPATETWLAYLAEDLWVSYRILGDPVEEVVIVSVRKRDSQVAERMAVYSGRSRVPAAS